MFVIVIFFSSIRYYAATIKGKGKSFIVARNLLRANRGLRTSFIRKACTLTVYLRMCCIPIKFLQGTLTLRLIQYPLIHHTCIIPTPLTTLCLDPFEIIRRVNRAVQNTKKSHPLHDHPKPPHGHHHHPPPPPGRMWSLWKYLKDSFLKRPIFFLLAFSGVAFYTHRIAFPDSHHEKYASGFKRTTTKSWYIGTMLRDKIV